MELKVICNCGQKYKFDVEPVNGQMPFAVTCPICGIDGTHLANAQIVQLPPPSLASVPVSLPVPQPLATPPPIPSSPNIATPPPVGAAAKIQLNRPAPPATSTAAPPVPPPVPPPTATVRPVPRTTGAAVPAVPKYLQDNPALQNNNFLLGALGAVIGGVVAVGLMIGAHVFFGYFPSVFTIPMGAIIGFAARLMYRGTDSSLGGVAALVAFFSIGGTLYLMFGLVGIILDVLWLLVGTAMAFKIASG